MANLTSDLKIIQRDPVSGKISYGMGNIPQLVSGVDKLVQAFVFALLNEPGRDALEPNRGAGLLTMIGQYNVDVNDKTSVIDEVYRRLDKAATDMKLAQEGLVNEDPNALLNTFRLITIPDSGEIDVVNVKIRLISMAGTTVDIAV